MGRIITLRVIYAAANEYAFGAQQRFGKKTCPKLHCCALLNR